MKKSFRVEWGYVRPFNEINIVCDESIAREVARAIYLGDKEAGCLILTDNSTGKSEILADCM